MGFVDAVKLGFQRYATFSGRSSRAEYWWWVLFALIAGAIAGTISETLGGVFALGTLLPGLAVAARRLHDIDKSGWWQLIWFIPLIGWIFLIVWLVRPGDAGVNRFGANPLATLPPV